MSATEVRMIPNQEGPGGSPPRDGVGSTSPKETRFAPEDPPPPSARRIPPTLECLNSPREDDVLLSAKTRALSAFGTPGGRMLRDDVMMVPLQDLDQDLYGFAIKVIIREHFFFDRFKRRACLSATKIASACLSVACLVLIQSCVIFFVRKFVTSARLAAVRTAYGDYERHMYGGGAADPARFTMAPDGQPRGLPEHFDPEAFASLEPSLQDTICHIPLSNYKLSATLLLIWSLKCFGELRVVVDQGHALLWDLSASPPDGGESVDVAECNADGEFVVENLKKRVKVVIALCVFVPRLAITAALLLLGSRWLVATTDFEEVVLNTMALEFVFSLKDVIYKVVVSQASQLQVSLTKLKPLEAQQEASLLPFVRTYFYGVLSFAWVFLYMRDLQGVLPDFPHDISQVCRPWIDEKYPLKLMPWQ